MSNVRTAFMDMFTLGKPKVCREFVLLNLLHLKAEVVYVGWLSNKASKKARILVIVGFTHSEDANAAIKYNLR